MEKLLLIVFRKENRQILCMIMECRKDPISILKKFVEDNFEIPQAVTANYKSDTSEDVVTHIKKLWTVLKRNPDKEVEGSSLLPLPNPYIVPVDDFGKYIIGILISPCWD